MSAPAKTRGLMTVESVKARCIIDRATHCWLWQGATATDGTPRLQTLDFRAIEKRTMSGPSAVWNIAHQAPPMLGWLVFRVCGHKLCLNPAHLKEARNRAGIGLHIRRAGYRVGTHTDVRRANLVLARAATGLLPTHPDIVLAIRAAPRTTTATELAALYGIAIQTASRIRRGESHKLVIA